MSITQKLWTISRKEEETLRETKTDIADCRFVRNLSWLSPNAWSSTSHVNQAKWFTSLSALRIPTNLTGNETNQSAIYTNVGRGNRSFSCTSIFANLTHFSEVCEIPQSVVSFIFLCPLFSSPLFSFLFLSSLFFSCFYSYSLRNRPAACGPNNELQTPFGVHTFSHTGPEIWNALPSVVDESDFIESF